MYFIHARGDDFRYRWWTRYYQYLLWPEAAAVGTQLRKYAAIIAVARHKQNEFCIPIIPIITNYNYTVDIRMHIYIIVACTTWLNV